jgi:hypothetical protein
VANIRNVGTRPLADIRADAVELALAWTDRLVDNPDELSQTERAVMGYVVAETERRGMLRVTCPKRAVAEYAKCSDRTALLTLKSLARKGLLSLRATGIPGAGSRRAAVYSLADPASVTHIHREGFPMGTSEALRLVRCWPAAARDTTPVRLDMVVLQRCAA